MARTGFLVASALFISLTRPACGVAPPSDPKALALASGAIAALTNGNSVSDVTITGTVTWNGSDAGTATLTALGPGESRIDLALNGGTRSEIRDASSGIPLGKWVSENGASGKIDFHNCQTDAAWFFPALGSLAGGANVVFSYIGQGTRNGVIVQHIQSYVYQSVPFRGAAPNFQKLSTADFYLDATTLLPYAATFNAHPDGDSGASIPVEIRFSNYQNVNGVNVPMSIQRYLNGSLQIDLTISNAAFNTGIESSSFTIN